MIELEIQGLALSRDGLMIEVGRLAVACGFTLQRQRLLPDPHGFLLTMVVRGPENKQRKLQAALDANERIISSELSPYVEGEDKPHFAATRRGVTDGYVPPSAEAAAEAVEAAANEAATPEKKKSAAVTAARVAPAPMPVAKPTLVIAPEPVPPPPLPTPEPDFEFILAETRRPPPAPPPAEEPYVELVAEGPDLVAVNKALASLALEYPRIMPRLQTMDGAVSDASREASLELAGQRTGAWVFARDFKAGGKRPLDQALELVALPALQALAEVELKGTQLHIRNSPLCAQDGHSGCKFFSGYLEGLLGPALASDSVSVLSVCCRSYGADACVLAMSE